LPTFAINFLPSKIFHQYDTSKLSLETKSLLTRTKHNFFSTDFISPQYPEIDKSEINELLLFIDRNNITDVAWNILYPGNKKYVIPNELKNDLLHLPIESIIKLEKHVMNLTCYNYMNNTTLLIDYINLMSIHWQLYPSKYNSFTMHVILKKHLAQFKKLLNCNFNVLATHANTRAYEHYSGIHHSQINYLVLLTLIERTYIISKKLNINLANTFTTEELKVKIKEGFGYIFWYKLNIIEKILLEYMNLRGKKDVQRYLGGFLEKNDGYTQHINSAYIRFDLIIGMLTSELIRNLSLLNKLALTELDTEKYNSEINNEVKAYLSLASNSLNTQLINYFKILYKSIGINIWAQPYHNKAIKINALSLLATDNLVQKNSYTIENDYIQLFTSLKILGAIR
jgi:hypothetical protein